VLSTLSSLSWKNTVVFFPAAQKPATVRGVPAVVGRPVRRRTTPEPYFFYVFFLFPVYFSYPILFYLKSKVSKTNTVSCLDLKKERKKFVPLLPSGSTVTAQSRVWVCLCWELWRWPICLRSVRIESSSWCCDTFVLRLDPFVILFYCWLRFDGVEVMVFWIWFENWGLFVLVMLPCFADELLAEKLLCFCAFLVILQVYAVPPSVPCVCRYL